MISTSNRRKVDEIEGRRGRRRETERGFVICIYSKENEANAARKLFERD